LLNNVKNKKQKLIKSINLENLLNKHYYILYLQTFKKDYHKNK